MNDTIWLTQEAYAKLRQEYDYLTGEGREIISKKIGAAREEGDLSENAGYHAAREEQGQAELRIRRLKAILDAAQVGEVGQDNDVVRPGATITVAYDGDPDDTDTFLLGSREMLALGAAGDIAVYSPQSPIGTAILAGRIGDEVSYEAPNGRQISITITAIEGFTA
jgi:transcription elongation factor GreA